MNVSLSSAGDAASGSRRRDRRAAAAVAAEAEPPHRGGSRFTQLDKKKIADQQKLYASAFCVVRRSSVHEPLSIVEGCVHSLCVFAFGIQANIILWINKSC